MSLTGRHPIGQVRAMPNVFAANERLAARSRRPAPELKDQERLELKNRVASDFRAVREMPGFKAFETLLRARHGELLKRLATETIKELSDLSRLQGQVSELELLLRQIDGIEEEGQRAAQELARRKEPSE